MCTMQTPLMKFPFYIAMVIRLLVYIRLDSISMKLTNIFKFLVVIWYNPIIFI